MRAQPLGDYSTKHPQSHLSILPSILPTQVPRDVLSEQTEQRILAAMSHLWPASGVVELRVLGSGRGTISGFYDDTGAFARDAARWSGRSGGVYWTINPVNPALLARASNRLREYVDRGQTTSDQDVIRRRFLPLDLDPVRPAGVGATHREHCEALALQGRIAGSDFMAKLGSPEPVEMDSGNGSYLLYPLDLPNDEDSREMVKRCLEALAIRFDCEGARVDRSIYNASRILRVPGTLNRKGDPTPERPHRRAILTAVPGVEL